MPAADTCAARQLRNAPQFSISAHILIFAAAFLAVVSRRPDAITHPVFYAEDGRIFFAQAYELGWRSLLISQAGYLHLFKRLIALMAAQLPLATAPLFMNLGAITVQVLPVNVLLSSRFSRVSRLARVLLAVAYIAVPNSAEINANVTNMQWHHPLLACVVLFGDAPRSWGWKVFDIVVLVIVSLDGPIGLLLVPIAAVLWLAEREKWHGVQLATLIPGSLLQAIVIVSSHTRPTAANGATMGRFISILARRVFLGLAGQLPLRFLDSRLSPAAEWAIAAVGLAFAAYATYKAPLRLKLFTALALLVLVSGLARPAGQPRPQWEYLTVSGYGDRYFVFCLLALIALAGWLLMSSRQPAVFRGIAVLIVAAYAVGALYDWRYPKFPAADFGAYAAKFQSAPPGTHMAFPIAPEGFTMELTKR